MSIEYMVMAPAFLSFFSGGLSTEEVEQIYHIVLNRADGTVSRLAELQIYMRGERIKAIPYRP